MIIIDGHEDLAWNALVLGRDITKPLEEIRAAEGAAPWHGEGVATVSLPSLRDAGVRVVLGTLYATPFGESTLRRTGYQTPEEAFAHAQTQMNYYLDLEQKREVTLIRTLHDLDAVLQDRAPAPGLVITMEGADPIRTPQALIDFVKQGVRIVGLAWGATRYAGGTGAPGGLTKLGVALLEEMEHWGMVLDASHLAEIAFWEAMELFNGHVVATHANARTLVHTDRQLSDAMITAIADRGGIIGLVCYNRFIKAGWQDGNEKALVTLDDLMRHAQHIARLVGSAHLGLGTDLDGGVGREVIPRELDSIADLPRFADAFATAGFTPLEIVGMMSGNWLRLLRGVLPT